MVGVLFEVLTKWSVEGSMGSQKSDQDQRSMKRPVGEVFCMLHSQMLIDDVKGWPGWLM